MAQGGPTQNLVVASSSRSVPMDDSSSLYFLYNGDHPGLTLGSHMLIGSNYNSWSQTVLTVLTMKNKVSFIDGSLPSPTHNDLLFGAWNPCNSMVTSWILNSVSHEIANSLLYMESAFEIWNNLRERFHQSNGPRVFQLKKHLMSLNQGSRDVNTYYTQLKIIWDQLKDFQSIPTCHCGGSKAWLEFQQ